MLTRRQHLLLLMPLALIVIPFLIWPALFGIIASFTNYAPFRPNIHSVGLQNYSDVLQDHVFQVAVRNIVLYTAVTVAVELALGCALAYALREPFRGREFLRFLFLIPWLVSPVANGVMWHFLVNANQGLLNYWPALLGLRPFPYPISLELALPTTMATEIWRKTPLVSFLVLPGLLSVRTDYWDQAKVLGMPFLSQMRHIVVSLLRPLLLTITLLLACDALGTFENILMLTGGGPGLVTLTPGLYSYQKAFVAYSWVGGATSAWLVAVGVLLVGLCYVWLIRHEAT
jgi:multiple sugar transport system permease protein